MAHKRIDFIEASVKTLFQYYDDDNNGNLNREEVRELLNDICSDLA
jgi:Ca2+-binding EF-hand superfamily protein